MALLILGLNLSWGLRSWVQVDINLNWCCFGFRWLISFCFLVGGELRELLELPRSSPSPGSMGRCRRHRLVMSGFGVSCALTKVRGLLISHWRNFYSGELKLERMRCLYNRLDCWFYGEEKADLYAG